jgi:hypothetical protein
MCKQAASNTVNVHDVEFQRMFPKGKPFVTCGCRLFDEPIQLIRTDCGILQQEHTCVVTTSNLNASTGLVQLHVCVTMLYLASLTFHFIYRLNLRHLEEC